MEYHSYCVYRFLFYLVIQGICSFASTACNRFGPHPSLGNRLYFIPVMNLYKPFSVMRELTLASFHAVSNSDHWKLKKAPAYIIVWWLLFLGGNIAFLFDLLIDYEAVGDYRRDALIGLLAHPMYVGSLLALYVIMKNITQTQTINKES